MEKDYNDYEASDFLNDSSFLEWMRHESKENDAFWENWIQEHPEKLEAISSAKEQYELLTSFEKIKPGPGEYEEVWNGIKKGMAKQAGLKMYHVRMFKWIAAASVILVLFFGSYYLINRQQPEQIIQNQSNDVAPGNNKAILTLANGQTIILDSIHTGQLTSQGNSKVMKADSGLLVYQSESLPAGVAAQAGLKAKSQKLKAKNLIKYNTLTIPRGGQYQLVLPDGTKVWLNAASSIRFPTAFTGKEREVSITGEVYMEVAEDANHPFIVHTRHSNIKVLGTRFNVMAYDNEAAVTTTLLQGSVKVSVPGVQEAIVLAAGQQASVGNKSQHISVRNVDAAAVAAWIHGLLSLKDCSIREFMNQLSRWYNVDIEYEGKVPQQKFGGMINRNVPLSDVLSALEAAGIHTKLEKQKIIVLSN